MLANRKDPNAIRLLQRALNALNRGLEAPPLAVDGRPGRRTSAALLRYLAARGRKGAAALGRALEALAGATGGGE